MNAEIFAEWLRRQGHQVARTESSWWYDAGPRVLQAFPYHWLIQPSSDELRELTLGRGNIALRYSTPANAPDGMISYHVILKAPYSIDMLRSQARNGVRRGLEHSCVERISFERLAKEGWLLQQDTLDRQGRGPRMTPAEWERLCLTAEDLPGFEAWAALVNGELAATILCARIDDVCTVPYAQNHRKYLSMHVNNALFYVASRDMLARDGVSEIHYGVHSLDAPESVNEFKFRMGLMAKPVRQRVSIHPLLRPLAQPLVEKILLRWVAHDPSNYHAAKAEGLLRFHLQSRLPLEEQDWPKCLSEYRMEVLGKPPLGQPDRAMSARIQLET